MNDHATAKIAMIDRSMRCFCYGLIGLLPAIGLPFVILSLWNARLARVLERRYWNVAKPYRIWGVVCAGFGAIICNGPIVFYLAQNSFAVVRYGWYGSD